LNSGLGDKKIIATNIAIAGKRAKGCFGGHTKSTSTVVATRERHRRRTPDSMDVGEGKKRTRVENKKGPFGSPGEGALRDGACAFAATENLHGDI